MSPRRKEIKRLRLLESQHRRWFAANSRPISELHLTGSVASFTGVRFIPLGTQAPSGGDV